jgi:hypothetical protein
MKPLDTAPPLVLVTWEDATLLDSGAWAENKDHKYSPKTFISVGFLLYDGKEGVILTSAWSVDTVAARDQIPRGMVRKVQKLKP